MTSRVQKGGTVFRPVLKPRTRLDSQQASVAGDHPDSDTNGSTPSMPSVSMPKPPILGERLFQETQSNDPDIPAAEAPNPSPPTNRPPSLVTANSGPITSTFRNFQLENTLHLPVIMGHSALVPTSAETSRPNLFIASGPISPTPLSPSAPLQSMSQSHVLGHFVAENMHEHINDAEAAIEPRSSPRRTVDSVGPNSHREVLDQAMRALAEASSILARDVSNSEPLTKRRKKRKAEAENSVSHSQPTEPQNDRRRRGSSGTPRPRKSRGPSLPPFDPRADPGEDLDPTVVTMASLCNDTGQGRISSKAAEVLSNHATWKAQNRAKRARMKTLMELKKYGREEDTEGAEENQNASVSKDPQSSNPVTATSGGPPVLNDTEGGFDYSQDLQASRYNVQVRIGPNGETIIDEESLVVDRTEVEDTTSYTHVVESDHTKFVNSGTYGRRYRGSRWSAEETELFYDALSQYGENYELIAYVLPGRDRKSCKNKFKAEDKKNPARINYCLRNSTPVDMVTLSRMTGKNFSGPVPEILVPIPQAAPEGDTAIQRPDHPAPDIVPSKSRRKKALNDDAVIIGELEEDTSGQ